MERRAQTAPEPSTDSRIGDQIRRVNDPVPHGVRRIHVITDPGRDPNQEPDPIDQYPEDTPTPAPEPSAQGRIQVLYSPRKITVRYLQTPR